jgi:hypothetical protein
VYNESMEYDVDPELADNEEWEAAAQASAIDAFVGHEWQTRAVEATAEESRLQAQRVEDKRRRVAEAAAEESCLQVAEVGARASLAAGGYATAAEEVAAADLAACEAEAEDENKDDLD